MGGRASGRAGGEIRGSWRSSSQSRCFTQLLSSHGRNVGLAERHQDKVLNKVRHKVHSPTRHSNLPPGKKHIRRATLPPSPHPRFMKRLAQFPSVLLLRDWLAGPRGGIVMWCMTSLFLHSDSLCCERVTDMYVQVCVSRSHSSNCLVLAAGVWGHAHPSGKHQFPGHPE